jgi:two-component system NtrC family sensor kinase
MKLFQNLSIRNKLIGIILFVTILTLGSGFTLVIISDIKSFKEDMKNHTIVIAQVTGDYCVSPLIFGDNTGAEQILAKLSAIPSIVNAIIYEVNGEIFAAFSTSEDNVITSPIVLEQSSEFVDNYLNVFQPIYYKDEYYGTIYLQASTELLNAKIIDNLRYIALLMVGLTMISIFLAIHLQRIISKPILNLASVAQNIAEKEDYSFRVQKEGNDEIGLLYDGFNNMLDQIQNREIERDRVEKALRESEKKFRTLTSNIPGAVYRCANDPEWTMDFISGVIEDISGYNESDFIKNKVRTYASIIHPDDRKMVEETVQKGISAHVPYIIEYRIVRSEGIIRWVYEKGQGIFSDNGVLLWLDGAIFDITERKQVELELAKYKEHLEELVETRTTELTNTNEQLQQEIAERKQAVEALRENEEKFESISASAQDAIIMMDNNGNISYWNEAAEKIFGYTKKEAIGKELHRFLGPERYYEAYRKAFNKFRNTGKGAVVGKTLELVGVKKDGREFPLELSLSSVKIRNKWNAIGIVRDITKRKLAEDMLRESEEKYRSLVANIPTVTWTSDSEGNIVFISPNIEKMCGFIPEEIYQAGERLWLRRIHPDDVEHVKEAYGLLFARNEIFDVEYRIRKKDGQWIWLHDRSITTYEKNGVMYADGVFSDITERVRAQEELKEMQAHLVQTEKMASLGMLVAGVAHEINTPVGAITSMYDTLVRTVEKLRSTLDTICSMKPKDQQKVNKLYKIIEDANHVITSGTERVTNIVRRLKSFARLDEAEFEKVNIHEGIEDTLTIVHHELKHKAVVERQFGNLPLISCNPSQLNQVYLNILVNAVQAIKDKGTITITTFQKKDHVYIQIKDTGIGIPKEALKKIFDPGYTTKGVGVGTGLGLSICYKIIKDHHGEILVDSEVDKGSTFTIVLPLKSTV